jgi:hypothetical protein
MIHWDGAKAKRFQRCYHNKLAMKALFDVLVPAILDYQKRDRCFGGLGDAAPLNSDDTVFESHLNLR